MFIEHSYQPTHFVHMIPAITSSNPLTGRTGRLHIFQTLVPFYRFSGLLAAIFNAFNRMVAASCTLQQLQ